MENREETHAASTTVPTLLPWLLLGGALLLLAAGVLMGDYGEAYRNASTL